jgi:thiamine-phosphate pyrophosphorylase
MIDISLHAIVDAGSCGLDRLPALARLSAEHGATLVQYRDKTSATRDMIERASAIREALAGTGIPLLINDRVDVALAAGADGVHLGRDDMTAATARRLLGPDAFIGATVKDLADADTALGAPIDYACIGGVFETLSKQNPDAPVGLEGFRTLRERLAAGNPHLPVGAIAGIDLAHVSSIMAAGADGIAVISAIFGQRDPAGATRALRMAVDAERARR